jgi:hypothetical protein
MDMSRSELLAERARIDSVIRRRGPLHLALTKPETLERLQEWAAAKGNEFADALLVCVDPAAKVGRSAAFTRHVLIGDDALVRELLKKPRIGTVNHKDELSALMLRPVAATMDVFLRIRKNDPRAFRNILAAIQDDLDPVSQSRVLEPPGPFGYVIYLRGSFNGWGTSDRFEYAGYGLYECVREIAQGRHELKVGTELWLELNGGSQTEGGMLVVNRPVRLFEERRFTLRRAFNLMLDLWDRPGREYRFVLDARRWDELWLLVSPVDRRL